MSAHSAKERNNNLSYAALIGLNKRSLGTKTLLSSPRAGLDFFLYTLCTQRENNHLERAGVEPRTLVPHGTALTIRPMHFRQLEWNKAPNRGVTSCLSYRRPCRINTIKISATIARLRCHDKARGQILTTICFVLQCQRWQQWVVRHLFSFGWLFFRWRFSDQIVLLFQIIMDATSKQNK